MAFTKITAAGIGSTETVTLDGLSVINNESIGGNLTVTGNATVGGVLTYEDVTNVDSIGLITARGGLKVNIGSGPPPELGGAGVLLTRDGNIIASGITTIKGNVKVGTGITLSPDGDGFFTGVVTATSFSGDGSGLTGVASTDDIRTNTNATFLQNINVSGTVTATSYAGDGSALTGLQAGKFLTDGVGITTNTPVGIETTSLARKDLTGPAGNTATGAGSSFHGAYMGDGFLSFNTEFSNPTGYYISTFTNALVCGPMQLGTTLTIDGNFTIV